MASLVPMGSLDNGKVIEIARFGALSPHYNEGRKTTCMDEQPPASQPTSDREDERDDSHDEPMLYCPVCSQRLISRKCKLLCGRCGYFMSCADYY